MKIFELREWMIDPLVDDDGNVDTATEKVLEELGWEHIDAYDGKQNHHPVGYGYWRTFDPKVVAATKKALNTKVSRSYMVGEER